jgi:hypothetical protein
MKTYNCNTCNINFSDYNSLKIHSKKAHKITPPQLYIDTYLNGILPRCKCGCGLEVKWFNNRFRDFAKGHYTRVHNNWGHNPKAIKNSANTRRMQFEKGERFVWNTGLKKETDDRVLKNSLKTAVAFQNDLDRQVRYSKMMKELWKSGKITGEMMSGKNHGNWRGGTSSINMLVRSDDRLYKNWKYKILKRDEFKCKECNTGHNLEVHHDKQTMSEILSIYVDKTKDYTFNEKKVIVDKIIEYHTIENVSGVTLCKNCHMKLHPSYNL